MSDLGLGPGWFRTRVIRSQRAAPIIDGRLKLGGARGTSRTCLSGFSNRRLGRNSLPGKNEIWLRAGELNATRMAYEASMKPVHLPAKERFGASAENRTPFFGMAFRCPANRRHSLNDFRFLLSKNLLLFDLIDTRMASYLRAANPSSSENV